eukprot:CAMPEP_0182419404 /NCGR_PEP_ID=MMETSP1167-20130531/3874_1 /TAXON_ID=2988 /ORGANISM="Mallomonas Sp, Strain CCMP3275" /LENGTH=468 /DNA_ID=CAMNT_0024594325 /DNA_START=53 /DNA_END=1459 /DNA_ORIENTATION=-
MGKGSGTGGEFNHSSSKSIKISKEELGKHRSPNDAWMCYKGKVYDVSGWNDHPGGSVIYTHAGDDFTDVFAAFHPASAIRDLDRFYIGDLDDTPVAGNRSDEVIMHKKLQLFMKGYRELRAKMIAAGLFQASYLFYVYKFMTNVTLLSASILCVTLSNSFTVHMVGALLLALFWQQCGWLAHDFLHHQVFKNRMYGDLMGIIVGDLFQGFSVAWWKSKHNTHHAVPNLHESSPESHDGDPDIDTMPILAWTLRMAETAKSSKIGRMMIMWQAVLYFPVLLFARLAWAHQSWVFVFGGIGQWSVKGASLDRKQIKYPLLEKLALILHHASLFYLLSFMPVCHAIPFFALSQGLCGLFLAIVFGLGHNGMAVYPANERPDFWKLQVTTTRNVTSTPFVDWFCGGLQYQVDHHLFPMVPRNNLKAVHVLVESFCKEHEVSYHEADMWVGTKEVLNHLNQVSAEFIEHFPAM